MVVFMRLVLASVLATVTFGVGATAVGGGGHGGDGGRASIDCSLAIGIMDDWWCRTRNGESGWSHPALRAVLCTVSPPCFFQVRRDRELDSAATHL